MASKEYPTCFFPNGIIKVTAKNRYLYGLHNYSFQFWVFVYVDVVTHETGLTPSVGQRLLRKEKFTK